MIWFIVRRLLGLILTLWIVFTLSFLLMHAVPGGPYSSERNLPPELEENFKEKYQLNLPVYQQYLIQLRRAATGDLGPSQRLLDYSVNEVIAQGLPVSATLGILALTFAITLGLSAGIVSGVYRGTAADVALMSLATSASRCRASSLAACRFCCSCSRFRSSRRPAGERCGNWCCLRFAWGPCTPPKSPAFHARACSMRCRKISSARPARRG